MKLASVLILVLIVIFLFSYPGRNEKSWGVRGLTAVQAATRKDGAA